jgi:hypothetical protein
MKILIKVYGSEKNFGYTGLDNQFTYCGKVVSPTQLPRSNPQKYHLSVSGTHFC